MSIRSLIVYLSLAVSLAPLSTLAAPEDGAEAGDEEMAGEDSASPGSDDAVTTPEALEEAPEAEAAEAAPESEGAEAAREEGEAAEAQASEWDFSPTVVGVGSGIGAGVAALPLFGMTPVLAFASGVAFYTVIIPAATSEPPVIDESTITVLGGAAALGLIATGLVAGVGGGLAWLFGNFRTGIWAAIGGPVGMLAGAAAGAVVGTLVSVGIASLFLADGSGGGGLPPSSLLVMLGGLGVTLTAVVPGGGVLGAGLGAGYASSFRARLGKKLDDVE